MKFKSLMTLCLAFAVHGLVAPSISAAERGPQYEEDDDAGSLPSNAKKLVGSGQVQSITGSLTGSSRGEGDYQDMYEVYIAVPQEFVLRVTQVTQGFDTQLFLFDADGFGLLANNSSSTNEGGSINAVLTNSSTDGTDVVVNKPGRYFIAISGFPSRPGNQSGPIFDFNPEDPFEVSGPDGKGGQNPISGWFPDGDTGSYVIALTGVDFLAPSPGACCLVDGGCEVTDAGTCEESGGIFGGDDSTCADVNCSTGACCFLKEYCYWECLELSENDCVQEYAATWHGAGTRCEDIQCPDPCYGACCVDGGCVLTVQALCEAQEGVFSAYSMCDDIECQSVDDDCPGDINGDDVVNILDLLKVIQYWGTCP